jgi:integrase/recombinase XerD
MQGSEVRALSLGHPLLDDYLAFVGARARVNTWLATAYDLKVFFTVVGKEPAQVTAPDVFTFLKAQWARPQRNGELLLRGDVGLPAAGTAPARRPAVVTCLVV